MRTAFRNPLSRPTSKLSFGTCGPQKDRFLKTGSGLGLSWRPATITRPLIPAVRLNEKTCPAAARGSF